MPKLKRKISIQREEEEQLLKEERAVHFQKQKENGVTALKE